MIQELVNYALWLKNDFEDFYRGIIHPGLHIEISLSNEGKVLAGGFKYEVYREGDIPSHFITQLADKENRGEIIPIFIIKNKYVDTSSKFFSSNNYYTYFFKLFKNDKKGFKFSDAFDFKNNRSILKTQDYKEKFQSYIQKFSKEFGSRLKKHYKLLNYKEGEDFDVIQEYLNKNFWNDFISKHVIDSFLFTNEKGELEVDKDLLSNQIYLTFNTENFTLNFNNGIDHYFSKKIALKEPKSKFQKQAFISEEDEKIYFFNPILSQDNKSKFYSRHLSHFSLINSKVEKSKIVELINLLKLIYNRKLPNPLPIFIDKDNLNKKVITLFRQDESKKKYTQIIKSLCKDHSEDLTNYYLLNYSKGKNLIINDMDLISNFKFWLNLSFKKETGEILYYKKGLSEIKHIFDLEHKVRFEFFDNEIKYFEDIQFSKNAPSFLKNNVFKYRNLLYDAFYKSRLYLITPDIFRDICLPYIKHKIANDETQIKKSTLEKEIIEKLLLYININKIFDPKNNNFGGVNMASNLPIFYENCLKLVKGEIDYYESDEDFAFGTGQLIRYLLELSESNNKNHSMFNPFLQKLGNFDLFFSQIKRLMMTYAHKVKMNYKTIDRLLSNTASYTLREGKSLKDMETMLICGYFAKSSINEVLGEKSKNNNDN